MHSVENMQTNEQLIQLHLLLICIQLLFPQEEKQKKKMSSKTQGSKEKEQMTYPNMHGQPELERAHGNPGESVAVMGFKSSREGGEK